MLFLMNCFNTCIFIYELTYQAEINKSMPNKQTLVIIHELTYEDDINKFMPIKYKHL